MDIYVINRSDVESPELCLLQRDVGKSTTVKC